MISRVYTVFVVALWLGSMTWLLAEKVLPPLLGGTPPDYRSAFTESQAEPDYWRISWNDRLIGSAASRVFSHSQGVRELRNAVKFENVPVESLVSEALGPWTRLVKPLFGAGSDFRANAVVATQIWFDATEHLAGFRTVLDLEGSPALFTMRGQVTDDGKLDVAAQFGESVRASDAGAAAPVFRQTVDLPPNALVGDAFTPRGQLKNLRVGQSWTVPVYRPFPPNSPVQILAVKAERHDVIIWDGKDVETVMLVYRSDAGSGLTVSRDPVATEWIRRDGVVLRQELSLSGVRLRFERLPPSTIEVDPSLLDPARHPHWWRGGRGALARTP